MSRSSIEELQQAMAALPGAQAVFQTRHHFADGMYCRELVIPKDCILVGKVHKHEHFCFIVKGEITIVSDDKRERIVAPAIFVSSPGAKRAGYAHEECIFVTVHRTPLTDLKELEAELVEPDSTALFDERNHLKALT